MTCLWRVYGANLSLLLLCNCDVRFYREGAERTRFEDGAISNECIRNVMCAVITGNRVWALAMAHRMVKLFRYFLY